MPFVSFSLFRVFILSVCFLLSLVFSPLSLTFFTFSVCLFLRFFLSFAFFASFYCFSFFFLDLPSFAWFSFHLRISFPSPFSSSFLPLSLFLFFVPVVGYSSFSSRPSLSPSFSILFPFGSACLSVASSFVLSPNFSLPRSSPFRSFSLLLPFLLTLLPFGLSSLLFAVFLFDVFLFPLSLLALFSFPFLCLVLLLFLRLLPLIPFCWPPPPLLPSFVYLASSFSASLTSSSFSA